MHKKKTARPKSMYHLKKELYQQILALQLLVLNASS